MSTTIRPGSGSKIARRISAIANQELEARRGKGGQLRPTQVVPPVAANASSSPAGQGLNYQTILNPTIQYELYNPADEPMEFGYNGETYVLPGAEDFWVGRDAQTGQLMEYTREGVLPVFGRPDQRIEALTIVKHATGDDGRSGHVGVNGVRPLFGDERDEEVIREAREAYVEKRRYDYEAMTRAWEAEVALALQQRREPGRPPRRVRDAYEWLRRNEQKGGVKISCPVCYAGFPNDVQVDAHMLADHKRHPKTDEVRERLGLEEDVVDLSSAETVPADTKPLPKSVKGAGKTLDETAGGGLSDEEAAKIAAEEEARKDAERKKNQK